MIDFLCIGAQKAGTTWLTGNLARHPQVWTPRFIKELHYFDVIHLGTDRAEVLKRYHRRGPRIMEKSPEFRPYFERATDPGFAFTDEWYAHVFSARRAGAMVGECTPLYCALPDEGVAHVRNLSPGVKLIHLIRDPYERLMSALRMNMDRTNLTDGKAVAHLLDNPVFLARGDYRANIPRWENHFAASQFLFLPFGRIKSEPMAVLRMIEEHLGLSPFEGYPKVSTQVNSTKRGDKVFDDAMVARIRDLVAPQYDYLASRFGADFTGTIR